MLNLTLWFTGSYEICFSFSLDIINYTNTFEYTLNIPGLSLNWSEQIQLLNIDRFIPVIFYLRISYLYPKVIWVYICQRWGNCKNQEGCG